MNWTTPIDAYCERTDAGFWSEPLNALTNVAFVLAALWAFALWRRRGGGDKVVLALILLVAVIGVGSGLFHTFANQWSVLADVVPIAAFIYGYFALALRRFVGLSRVASFLGTLAFGAFSYVAEPLAEPVLGSSAGYFPALLALWGIGAYTLARGIDAGRFVLLAGFVFALSLGFRMVDLPLCEAWPLGTHPMWHILNATTLALCLRAAIGNRRSGS